ncbi:MAG: acyl-CoA dehydrogenase family protein [Porticoccaceae bacterium]|nr:acyl-CoA dehydrogenase family protein [Porticoccaceae bacterium]
MTEEEITFQTEVRQFLVEYLSADLKRSGRNMTSVFADYDCALRWHKILHKQGWAAPEWPEEHGGTNWTQNQRQIFQRELKLGGAPAIMALGIQMLGPIIIKYGTEEQKHHYLPRMLAGDDIWCQGYSEPGAGSDLASLATRAERDGDHYVVNGSKIWTSFAHRANKIFCLVRTSTEGRPQAGISFLLADMDTQGISLSEIIGLDGTVEQCQVFFSDARIPVTNLIGEENQGWNVAKYLLEFERGGHNYSIDHQKLFAKVRAIAGQQYAHNGICYLEEPAFSADLAELEIDALALEYTEQRIKASDAPGSLTSVAKLAGTELSQKISALSSDALGAHNAPLQHAALEVDYSGKVVGPENAITTFAEYVNMRAATIYGGSAEIQRNIISRAVLGLR